MNSDSGHFDDEEATYSLSELISVQEEMEQVLWI